MLRLLLNVLMCVSNVVKPEIRLEGRGLIINVNQVQSRCVS